MSHDGPDILLVEDNPDDAEAALRALGRRNLADSLLWVKDGAEALEFMFGRGAWAARGTHAEPKVVLLDMKLPKVDGIEVLAALKADARTRAVPVVMLTSSTQDEDMLRSYELGVNSYVSKPVEFERFSEVVAELGTYWVSVNRRPG